MREEGSFYQKLEKKLYQKKRRGKFYGSKYIK